jgi:hypothetical protein
LIPSYLTNSAYCGDRRKFTTRHTQSKTMSTTGPVCDPATGICALPSANEKISSKTPSGSLSNLEIFRSANVTTLNNDHGDPIPIESLQPTPLTLLYFSAVFLISIHVDFVVMVSSMSFIHTQTVCLPSQKGRLALHPRIL